MFKKIELEKEDGTRQEYPFMANATTALRFRQIFRVELMASIMGIIAAAGTENLLKVLQEENDSEKMLNEDGNIKVENLSPEKLNMLVKIVASGEMESVSKLAYIMNRQAEKEDMSRLSFEDYVDWLEQFESMELLNHAMDFINIYMGNKASTSEIKKDSAQLTEN